MANCKKKEIKKKSQSESPLYISNCTHTFNSSKAAPLPRASIKPDIDANYSGTAQQGVNASDGETWWREEWEDKGKDGVKEERSG